MSFKSLLTERKVKWLAGNEVKITPFKKIKICNRLIISKLCFLIKQELKEKGKTGIVFTFNVNKCERRF